MSEAESGARWSGRWTAAGLLVAALAIASLPSPAGAPENLMTIAGLLVVVIGIWASDCLPEHVGALVFFLVASLLELAPPQVVFSGFSTSAFWLVFSGLVLGVAASQTGLGQWIASALVDRIAGSYGRLIAAIVIGATVLGFLIPSAMARCFILIPIMLALADDIGFERGHPGRKGMIVAAALASLVVPASILSANLPNVLMAGAAERLYGIELRYTEFLLLHFPVTGVLKAVALIWLVLRLFPATVEPRTGPAKNPQQLGRDGRRMLWITSAALALWMSDFLHGISPGWIALAAALICMLPIPGLISAENFRTRVSYPTLLFTASVIGAGALIADSGFGTYLAERGLAAMGIGDQSAGAAFATLTGLTFLLGIVATAPGTVVILTSLAQDIAAASELDIFAVLMTVIHACNHFLFPYQAGPVLVALKLGGVGLRDGVRVLVPLAVLALTLLAPLTFWWWRLLGYL